MIYEVIYTRRALNDLRNIHRYIEIELLAPDAARSISDKIMTAAEKLDEMPERYPLYGKSPWKQRGLRKMNVDNFMVFYMPIKNQKQVLIIAIMYGKRNIERMLNDE